jgi:hypothetical protein
MVIHEMVRDQRGAGKWDVNTTRYIPVYGGSRSRLPVADDPDYRRYPGFVGIDEHLTESIYLIGQLYHHIGGKPIISPGVGSEFVSLILGNALAKLEAEAVPEPEPEQ